MAFYLIIFHKILRGNMQYVIKDGDTLQKIADYYGISVTKLKEYNGITNENLDVGMIINIPYESPLEYYQVKEGDDLYSIATKNSIPVEFLAKLNGLKVGEYIYPKQELLVPKNSYKIYLTSKGDSVNSVTNKLSIGIDDIFSNNKDLYLVADQLIIYKK